MVFARFASASGNARGFTPAVPFDLAWLRADRPGTAPQDIDQAGHSSQAPWGRRGSARTEILRVAHTLSSPSAMLASLANREMQRCGALGKEFFSFVRLVGWLVW